MLRLFGIMTSLTFAGSVAERLDVISLPTGFQPEGITLGRGSSAYVGSYGDGSIWMGDLDTGEGGVVIPGAGSYSVGLDFDRRSGYLFVRGGLTGTARVYDEKFVLVANISMVGADTSSFVNDVIVTKTSAYFTDSFQPQIYSVKLDRNSGELVGDPTTITLSSDFNFIEGEINANGIEASDDGSVLIVANMVGEELYTVDPKTGAAAIIDLSGDSVSGDGLILRKNTLWVTENGFYGGPQQVSEGNSLYVVSAKFGVAEADKPSTEYEILRMDRDEGVYACPAL